MWFTTKIGLMEWGGKILSGKVHLSFWFGDAGYRRIV
jgi:hypothetical protein